MNLAEQAKKAGMSEEEIQTLRDGEAELSGKTEAAAEEPAPVVEAAAAAAEEPAATPKAEEPATPAAEVVAEAATEVETPVAESMPVPAVPENADARLTEIRSELKAARAKAFSGEMTPDEYSDLEDKLSAERESIVEAKRSAEQAHRYNEQRQAEFIADTRAASFKEFKAEGVDYSDKAMRAKFDRALSVLVADPEYASKPLAEIGAVYAEAHKMVKALIGFQPKTAAKPVVAAAVPREAPKVPTTLAGLPAAAPASVQDETMQKLHTLDGEDLEKFYAGLSKTEAARILKMAS